MDLELDLAAAVEVVDIKTFCPSKPVFESSRLVIS
jgi:hypothetical protein